MTHWRFFSSVVEGKENKKAENQVRAPVVYWGVFFATSCCPGIDFCSPIGMQDCVEWKIFLVDMHLVYCPKYTFPLREHFSSSGGLLWMPSAVSFDTIGNGQLKKDNITILTGIYSLSLCDRRIMLLQCNCLCLNDGIILAQGGQVTNTPVGVTSWLH